jgi:peptidoglycan/xylan/chitin deacetylase (PgdA/CDA1 family)
MPAEETDPDKSSLPWSRRQLIGGVIVGVGAAACSSTAHPVAGSAPSPTPTSAAPTHSAAPRRVSVATEIVHGSRTKNAVALTFHGAGDPSLARSLLSEAERAGAKLTVLAVGTWLVAEPAMAKRILDGGHELGNHTYHHLPMRRLSATSALDEITRCAKELTTLTGSAGHWFRPSGTPHATRTILTAAARAGYPNSLSYDVDPRDYQDPPSADIVNRVMASARPGSIISLHLGHAGTVRALPSVLDGLHSRGLSPVTVSELLA